MNVMLEAIQKIQEAERHNEQLKEALIQSLKKKQEEQTQELQTIQKHLREKTLHEVELLESNLQEALQNEKKEWLLSAEKTRKNYQRLYEERKDEAVKTIIERVKQTYGRL